jgi:L-2-hydroxyglutarate oxidase
MSANPKPAGSGPTTALARDYTVIASPCAMPKAPTPLRRFSPHSLVMYDQVIIGGGIIGLSTAWQLKRRQPCSQVLVLEKESHLARHQTGHNSGVMHTGIYYEPDSLKAEFCRAGLAATMRFCDENDIPYEQCGKLLVATNELEHRRMLELHGRAQRQGLDVALLDALELKSREPNIAGTGAIYVKDTGIVDYARVCTKMAERFQNLGGEIRLGCETITLHESADRVDIKLKDGSSLSCGYLIGCAGLMADRVARMFNIDIDFRIVPFRGEYYRLPAARNNIVKHLIYPIPDPDLPFLGIHLTRMIDGSVTVGPNAVLGWKREGYGRINVNPRDAFGMLGFSGFWRLLRGNFVTGVRELRNSVWKRSYLKLVQKYCPSLQMSDLQPYPAGIRAQTVLKDGTLVHDFLFAETRRSLHVCNAPSPAATSAIPIGSHLCSKIEGRMNDV